MDISSDTYLDAIVVRVQEEIPHHVVSNIRTVDRSLGVMMDKERKRLGLDNEDDFPEAYNDIFNEAFRLQANLLPGGWYAINEAYKVISAALIPDVAEALCRELVPSCALYGAADWFTIRWRCRKELSRVLFMIVLTRLVYQDDSSEEGGFKTLIAQLRELLS